MSISGIFVLIALGVGVLTFIVWPLISVTSIAPSAVDANAANESLTPLAVLRNDHEAILVTLRDLDFDYQTNKLSEDDYQQQRAQWVARGIETLRQIDGLESELVESVVAAKRAVVAEPDSVPNAAADFSDAADARIEAVIAAHRKQ